MLYRIEIENFYSVRDPQVLDLRVSRAVTEAPERFGPVFPGSVERAPKVVALFGPNGSGKSTVLKAVAFLSWFMQASFQHPGPYLPCERFNDTESGNRPIRLAVEFGAFTPLTFAAMATPRPDGGMAFGTYRYELELRPVDGFIRTIEREALRFRRDGEGKWQRGFERRPDGVLLGSRTFPLSGFGRVIDKIRPNAGVVSTLALFEHEASKVLVETAKLIQGNILLDLHTPTDTQVFQALGQDPVLIEALNHELQRIDLGVSSMRLAQTDQGPRAIFRHHGLDMDMPWELESQGTRSFIRLFPLLFTILRHGGVALIDELDLSIHPLLLPEIVRWFHDPARNPRGGQLWMSCHSASLLDDLFKEEIVLCEKDKLGRTSVYGLADVSAVRRSDNLYRKYLGGAYGAVPQIG